MNNERNLPLTFGLSSAIGLRFLTAKSANRFISFISMTAMFGIAIGISVLLVIMSAMNGFEQQLRDRLLSVVPHGEIIAVNQPIPNWQQVVNELKHIPGVVEGAPVIAVKGLVLQGNDLSGISLDGILPQQEAKVMDSASYVTAGAWQQLTSGSRHIVLGQGLIDKFGFEIGDSVSIMIPQKGKQGRLSAPTAANFTLVGSFKFGGQLDALQAYIHLDDARELANISNGVLGIRFKFSDIFSATETIRDIGRNVKSYVYLSDWTRTQGHLYNDIKLVQMITYIVLMLVIAVASFNIVSTLVMAVNDKESEIAILLTMGLSSAQVKKIFIVQGMINSALGCLLGGVLGTILSVNLPEIVQFLESVFDIQVLSGDIYFIDSLPAQFEISDLLVLVGATLTISFLATLYPATSAAKIKPAMVLGQ
ncbi:MAG: lipoprotein-releasing ABC transporter permease subunit [Psychrobium sp.]